MRFVRLVIALSLAMAGVLLGTTGSEAIAAPEMPATGYSYNNDCASVASIDTASDRGPPDQGYTDTAPRDAVDLRSHGASARVERIAPSATTTYDTYTALVWDTWVTDTTQGRVEVTDGHSGVFQRGSVAANGGSRLAEASSSAFRAADNVGDFTVSAKHLPGAGGRWNKWAEGVDINGTIANALRSDGAAFLPNAGGAADSFIVRTNVGSVIGTKGQTVVKAVISNDGRIITAYPVK
jgi:hypothetical protein